MLLVGPLRKHLTFTFGSIDFRDLRNVRHAEHPQLANLPGPRTLRRKPSANELKVFFAWRVLKNRDPLRDATLQRSAASSAPAPPESIDATMTSAGATGSFLMTSAHPAARNTGSRSGRIATIANAANASAIRIRVHLGHLNSYPASSRCCTHRDLHQSQTSAVMPLGCRYAGWPGLRDLAGGEAGSGFLDAARPDDLTCRRIGSSVRN